MHFFRMLINEVDDDVRGGTTSHYSMPSVNSRLQVLGGTHIWRLNLMHFLMFFVFWVFFWGGIWDSGRGIPPPRRTLEITLAD